MTPNQKQRHICTLGNSSIKHEPEMNIDLPITHSERKIIKQMFELFFLLCKTSFCSAKQMLSWILKAIAVNES